MKKFFALLALATILSASSLHKEVKFGDIKAQLSSIKPLSVGLNSIKITIKKANHPLDAKVAVKFFMPSMPSMPYMEHKTLAKPLGNGVYEATFNASMGGTWQVHIFITTKDGKKYRLKSSINL